MKGLRLCCKGVEQDVKVESDLLKEQTIAPNKAEPCHKAGEATVIPPKRKLVKKMMCTCVIHCICDKCFNTKTNTNTKAVVYDEGIIIYVFALLLYDSYSQLHGLPVFIFAANCGN
ncbi:hypothetical protein VNO78_01589 [Psophocarpus tetragonolobus]|uniref:Uncharacterized protein n=1 Tax=Psophocarpus tetragonolobus TaxID=3891 RepID=A0AAN9XUQ5_PSOTE